MRNYETIFQQIRKRRADSTGKKVEAAQARENSADAAPEIDGMAILNERGRAFYETIHRQHMNTLTQADLYLLIEAAFVHQQLIASRCMVAMQPATVTHSNGLVGRNPVHVAHLDLTRQYQTLLRDIGIRNRDGAVPDTTAAAPRPSTNVDSEAPLDYEFLRMN